MMKLFHNPSILILSANTKKFILSALALSLAALAHSQQPVTPVRISGWNVDGIAEGELPAGTTTSFAAMTTTAPLDLPRGSASVLYSRDFRGLLNQSTPPFYGLSEDGQLIGNMNGYTGVFRIRDYKKPNIGQILNADSIELNVLPYQPAEGINLLVFSSEGSSQVGVKPRFRSITADTAFYQNEFVADWFNVDSKNAINSIGRVSRNTDAFSGTNANPHLDVLEYTMSSRQRADYLSKLVIKKNQSGSYFNIVGVSVVNSYDPPFVRFARALTSPTDFEVSYTSSVTGGSYIYEVASDSLFTDYVPSMQLVPTTSTALTLTVPGSLAGDTVYFRVRVIDANGRGSAFTEPSMIKLSPISQLKAGIVLSGQVWPNPLKRGELLKLPEGAEIRAITNMLGQRFDSQTLSAGLYQVNYQIGLRQYAARLVVE